MTEFRIPLIGEMAPEFNAASTMGQINFPADYNGKWTVLFSHPADFTPVCSTEILELASNKKDFDALNPDSAIEIFSTFMPGNPNA